ncbi:DNA mismatch repair protein PMS1 [Verticillium dahliae VdLs.17]|uniref:DNA mismatch repair protein PMS1 n=1 Tax=Verticillium dahliae (strain VdLs.17 / ATCC MYA-4575 / FGSC 10137) TaxID=498257 RepID=G2XG62_VERDV|nr:DNA mismatch repair protein PMS1 [Verticillium dahliae VdLs.17]EGY18881.1 DNA mismatch repair protein PMS1 [Verticillium dahliae VdLs.17]KAH6663337.1 DNA mismatch repair protein PMS1 [Verticillium dahliae]KAH6702585.1 DNA mismatch repair protein PMS1 [Verticillium dahliae]
MAIIKAIEANTVHRIQSGQVIVDLCSVVKELVENSLDANATAIDVRFKNQGLESIEVHDNGSGISPDNYEGLALKHHTSKLATFSDLNTLSTFGFRGEALSSLCALSQFSVVTCLASDAPRATKLEFEPSGRLKGTTVVAGQKGTVVTVNSLFHNLPVRRRELERNIKREWNKVITLLNQYACIQTGLKFTISQQPNKGKRIILFSTKGNTTVRDNIINIFGAKTTAVLTRLDVELQFEPSAESGLTSAKQPDQSASPVHVKGFVSRPAHGEGRQTPDRQMFFVNGRPCILPQFAKVFNDVYRSYNSSQSPFILADIQLDTHLYDVNVSPDKRTILMHEQNRMLESLREALTSLFESQDYSIPLSHMAPSKPGSSVASSPKSSPDKQSPLRRVISDTSNDDVYRSTEIETDTESAENASDNQGCLTRKSQPVTAQALESPAQALMDRWIAKQSNNTIHEIYSGASEPSGSSSEAQHGKSPAKPMLSINSKGVRGEPSHQVFSRPKTSMTNLGITENSTSSRDPVFPDQDPLLSTSKTMFVSPTSISRIQRKTGSPRMVPLSPEAPAGAASAHTSAKGNPHEPASHREPSLPSSPIDALRPDDNQLRSYIAFSGCQKPTASHAQSTATEVRENNQHLQRATLRNDEDLEVAYAPPSKKTREPSMADSDSDHQVLVDADPDSVDDQSDVVSENLSNSAGHDPDEEPQASYRDDQSSADSEPRDRNRARSGFDALSWISKRKDATLRYEQTVKTDEADLAAWSEEEASEGKGLSGSSTSAAVKAGLEAENAEDKLSLIISKSDFDDMAVVGQFNLGFILAVRHASGSANGEHEKSHDSLFIIDQHASDEKYNFERLQSCTTVQSQHLVQPKQLELTALEEEIVRENISALEVNGFKVRIDDSGSQPVGLRCELVALPLSRETTFTLADLEELISLLGDHDLTGTSPAPRPSRVRKMFAMRACRSSIMVGKALTHRQMERLVRHMGELDKPWNCPHGRPTMRHIYELASWDENSWVRNMGQRNTAQENVAWASYARTEA